jgi:hypothetical protein
LQNARHIRPDLDARAHLTQLRCALEQLDWHAALCTRQCSRQAANTATCDQHLFVLMSGHLPIVPSENKLPDF